MLISSGGYGQEGDRFRNGSQFDFGQIINLGNLNFPPDSASLDDPATLEILDSVIGFLGVNPSIFIEVRGHTSGPRPGTSITLPYLYSLSEKRAEAVAFHLIHLGISPQRIEYRGYGPEKPIASNATAQGRYANQRVEIMITDEKK